MGYNLSDHVIWKTPDKTYYSSGVFISLDRFVWVSALEKFIPVLDFSMYTNGIIVRDENYFLIFNHFDVFLAKSISRVEVNQDGYVIVQDPVKHILEG